MERRASFYESIGEYMNTVARATIKDGHIDRPYYAILKEGNAILYKASNLTASEKPLSHDEQVIGFLCERLLQLEGDLTKKPEDRTIFDWFNMKRAELIQEEKSCEKWGESLDITKAKQELLEEVFGQVVLEFEGVQRLKEEMEVRREQSRIRAEMLSV